MISPTALRTAREQAGLTYAETAQALGVTCRYLLALESGREDAFWRAMAEINPACKREPADVQAMATLYGMPVESLSEPEPESRIEQGVLFE